MQFIDATLKHKIMGKLNLPKKTFFTAVAVASAVFVNAQTAKVQVIHNSADPAAANVAVWLINGANVQKAIDNFAFREATAYLDLPADVPIKLAISPAGATSVNDTIPGLTTEVTLPQGGTFIAMALGNVGNGFSPNPDAKSTSFRLLAVPNARQTAQNPNNIEFIVVHGATDVPAVDVYVRGNSQPLVNDAAYGDATPYYSVPEGYYLLDLTLSNNPTPLATFELDLEGGAGNTVVLFASGYLQPSLNSGGERLGLFAALANGDVEEVLPPLASVQVIHNSAAPAAANVDVYATVGLYSDKIIDNFEFREATGFIDVPALTPVKISFAPASSTSIADTIAGLSQTVTLDTFKNYIAMAVGNVGTGFAANPDGVSTAFRLLLVSNARTQAAVQSNIDVLVVHGSTDAPTVDVIVEGNGTKLVNNAKFGDATSYASIAPTSYRLLVQDSGNTTTVAAFSTNLSTLGGTAAVVFASGYLNPATNNNGPGFGLFAAVDDVVLPLTNSTSVADITKTIAAKMYPNPAKESLTIEFELAGTSPVAFNVFDNSGKTVYTQETNGVQGTNQLLVNTLAFETGVYYYTLTTAEGININRFAVAK